MAGERSGTITVTKPPAAPDIFLLAAQKLGTEPAKTMVLEDSYNGVRAGAGLERVRCSPEMTALK